jgi:hypothetical protein
MQLYGRDETKSSRFFTATRQNSLYRNESGKEERAGLQLGLLGLGGKIRHQHVTDIACRLVEVVAHALGTDALADDVEVKAVRISVSL